MDLSSALLVPPIYACIEVIAVGLLLWRISRFGRRVGSDPHCRGCDYPLIGIDSSRCPECGRSLTSQNIRRGDRPPRRRLRAAGIVLCAAGAVALVPIGVQRLKQVDWYFYRSSDQVIFDACSMNAATADRAWGELIRRRNMGQLSAEDEQKLIAAALDEHAKPRGAGRGPNWGVMADHLLRQYDADGLTTAQSNRFLRQVFRVQFAVRPVVLVGEAVPYELRCTPELPPASRRKEWSIRVQEGDVSVDGNPIPKSEQAGFEEAARDEVWESKFDCARLGRHVLRTFWRVELLRVGGVNPAFPGVKRALLQLLDFEHAFEIVADPKAAEVALVDKPAIERAMMAAAEFRVFTSSSEGDIRVMISLSAPPENIAYEVLVQGDGPALSLGSIALSKGNQMDFILGDDGALQHFRKKKVNMVLRPSAVAARKTVDLTQIWGGEMVFRDVLLDPNHRPFNPIKPTSPATRPATLPANAPG